jgi:hypothetical protein
VTELRLAAIDGQRTIQIGAIADVLGDAREFVRLLEQAEVQPDTVMCLAVIDGRLRFDIWGRSPTIAEGIGLLELAKSNLLVGARE